MVDPLNRFVRRIARQRKKATGGMSLTEDCELEQVKIDNCVCDAWDVLNRKSGQLDCATQFSQW